MVVGKRALLVPGSLAFLVPSESDHAPRCYAPTEITEIQNRGHLKKSGHALFSATGLIYARSG